jgi:ribonucleotide monophosphatase NagD (HAD superfamily)
MKTGLIPQSKAGILCDMDGVIYHGNTILPGTQTFVGWLRASGIPFLFLTNSSERSPRELSEKLQRMGVDIEDATSTPAPWPPPLFWPRKRRAAAPM